MGSIIKNHNKVDPAIIYFDENNLKSISFGDLEEISNRFANALLVLGLTEGKACSL
jgi:acyl-coenzyme A synthetase/AMP-(fatty) acid ligase